MRHIKSSARKLSARSSWAVRSLLRGRSYYELNLPLKQVDEIIRTTGAQEWFIWSIHSRAQRGEANAAMGWIAVHVNPQTSIFETGCGCAANLIWLGQQGFTSLAGSDISPEAIAAARRLAALAGLSIALQQDDSIAPKHQVVSAGVLVALNWTYFVPNFELGGFLTIYHDTVERGGFVIFDMVDIGFNNMPDHQFMTDDWSLPLEDRRPTQYVIRMSPREVREVAEASGFDVVTVLPGTEIPPRFVTVLKRR